QSRQFGYDTGNRLTSLTTPRGTETFGYDDQSKLTSYTTPNPGGSGSTTYVYEYGPNGQLSKKTGPAGTAPMSGTWDRQPAWIPDSMPDTQRSYQYDTAGRLTGETDTGWTSHADLGSRRYGYDALDRPKSEIVFDAAGLQSAMASYTWDANG